MNPATRAALAACALLATGCSMYWVRGHFASSFDRSNFARRPEQRLHLSVVPSDDWRFLFLGPPGIPIVPVYAALGARSSIALDVQLEVPGDADFSLAWYPCLQVEGEEPLCPESAEVSWLGTREIDDADGDASYRHIPALAGAESWPRDFDPTTERGLRARVTRTEIFERSGYAGEPAVYALYVRVVYVFPCRAACPEAFSLDAGDLARVDGQAVMPGLVPFREERQSKYDALYKLQD